MDQSRTPGIDEPRKVVGIGAAYNHAKWSVFIQNTENQQKFVWEVLLQLSSKKPRKVVGI